MSIIYNKDRNVFVLNTGETTYGIAIVDGRYVAHGYYGKRIPVEDVRCLLREDEEPLVPSRNKREKAAFLDTFWMEFPEHGMGDFREAAFCMRTEEGYRASELEYCRYEIVEGKPKLEGLPATWGEKEECTTLKLYCRDEVTGVEACLQYSVFEDVDGIVRSVVVRNHGNAPVYLEKVYSGCLDMEDQKFEVLTLMGVWGRERHIQRIPLGYGRQRIASFRGESSHQEHPFMALVTPETTEDAGEVYAMNFVYSGNFVAQAEKDPFDSVRMVMGIHPEDFCWKLEPGGCFTAPEVVMVYSDQGLGKMTRCFHKLYRNHLIRSPYLHRERPVLINNWEATYFDFDEKKLLDIAKEASELGIEMLVMDDGWFGCRDSDENSLGDWKVYEDKLKGGLRNLVGQVNGMGMKFGIWFEPEMVSPDSELFRAHKDWAIQIPGRDITLSRAQCVLDLSRTEVVDAVYGMVAEILRSAPIAYVKWDMNRALSTLGSVHLPPDRMGELSHRYMLGVYEMQRRLTEEFPDLLLENCSSGGGRFDPGMLYYSPQIWCSDDTDAIERLAIQEGTALIYPLSCIGAHVSACPNHVLGRTVPFETRGHVALAGTFGYELDITKLSRDEKEMVKEQVKMYHRFHRLIAEGEYYRLASYRENGKYDSWMVVSQDQKKGLLFFVQVLAAPNWKSHSLRLKGLDVNGVYKVEEVSGQEGTVTLSGAALMNAGLRMKPVAGDFKSFVYELQMKDM